MHNYNEKQESDKDSELNYCGSEQEQNDDLNEEKNLEEEGIKKFNGQIETNQYLPDNNKIFLITKEWGNKTTKDDIKSVIEEEFIIYNKIITDYAKDYIPEPVFQIYINAKNNEEFKKKLYYEGNIYKKLKQKMFKPIKEILQKKFGKEFKCPFTTICQSDGKEENKIYLSMTLKKLLTILKNDNGNFVFDEEKKNILEKLENDETDKKFGKMLKMKIEDIYNEFLRSNEFQELIKELIDNKDYNYPYIHFVVKKAQNYVAYYKGEKQE
jgi:hypothetical protein